MKKLLLLHLCLLFSIMLSAQTAGDVDPTFAIGDAFNKNGTINVTAIQSDGKIIVAGDFYTFEGASTNRIVRLNADGTRDNSFNAGTGFNGSTFALAIQPDGKILVGGNFTTFNNISSNYIARLNTDGTLDTTFVVGTGFDIGIRALAIQTDGKILVGGAFTTYNGSASKYITRLNTNGSVDASFNTGTSCNNTVYTIILQPDGKSIIGGAFTTFNGVTVNRLVRLTTTGALDFSGLGFNSTVTNMVLQPDGKLIVVGSFTTVAGIAENRIVRLNTDATIDTSFVTGTGFDRSANALALQPDGKLLIGGSFTFYNSSSANRIIRLNANGTIDSSFSTGTGLNNYANNMVIQPDGKMIVAGNFNYYDGINSPSLIRLNTNGAKDASFNIGSFISGSVVYCLEKQTDGKILAGGEFTSYFGAPSTRLIRLNTDGTKDTSFNVGTGFNTAIFAVAVQTDGKILAGGQNFITYNGSFPNNSLVRLNTDGSLDTSFNMDANVINNVFSIKIQADGKIVVGGTLYLNGIFSNAIIRLNTNGTLDTSFVTGVGFDSNVWSMALQTDGKIIVCGPFATFNGTVTAGIARLNSNGSLDTTFNTGTGFNQGVASIIIQSDNKIVVGGYFTTYNSTSALGIIRLNSDGANDTSFTAGTGFDNGVDVLALQEDGKIIAGGSFSSYNATTANQIIRLDQNGVLDTAFATGTGCNNSGYVAAITIQNDKKIVLGGVFWNYNSHFANRIVRLSGDSFLATENFNTTAFSVYPNPAKSILNLQLPNQSKVDSIIITDLTGKIILEQTTSTASLNTENLAKGMYFLQAFSGNEKFTSKFIKE